MNDVSKACVEIDEIDRDIAAQAADILGTATLRDTIDAALHEIVNARRRLELMALLSEPGRFDFDAVKGAWEETTDHGPHEAPSSTTGRPQGGGPSRSPASIWRNRCLAVPQSEHPSVSASLSTDQSSVTAWRGRCNPTRRMPYLSSQSSSA